MAKFQTDFSLGRKIAPYDDSGNLVSVRVDFNFNTTAMYDSTGTKQTAFAVNDVIDCFKLPAGHLPVDLILMSDAFAASGSATLNVGVINATDNGIDTAAANGGAAWLASVSAGTTALAPTRPSTSAMWKTTLPAANANGSTEYDRRIGIHVGAIPTTLAASGNITLIMTYRSAGFGL